MLTFRSRLSIALLGLVCAPFAFSGSPVNINTASTQQLSQALDGVGPSKAKAIVAWRTDNGPFESSDQITKVPGIGPSIFERNAEFILIESSGESAAE